MPSVESRNITLSSQVASFESRRTLFLLSSSSSRLPLFPCKHPLRDPVEFCYRSAQKACRLDTEERRSAAAYRARGAPCWSWWMFSRAPVHVKRVYAGCVEFPLTPFILRKSRGSLLYRFWNKFRCERSRFHRFLMNTQRAIFFFCLWYSSTPSFSSFINIILISF